jgi:NADPH:quinone reductase-like Zn-dependent oxidoreductase
MLDHKWLASVPRMLGAGISSMFSSTRAKIVAQAWNPDDLVVLLELIEAGRMTPVIDRTYTLAEAADAIAYVGDGHARGKVVIEVLPVDDLRADS